MTSKMATKGHVTIFFIIIFGSNECSIYWQHSVKFPKQYVEWFWLYSLAAIVERKNETSLTQQTITIECLNLMQI